MKISILLPTRGRTDVLKKSIESLLDTVKEPNEIEFILGMDEDDPTTIDYVKETLGPILQEKGVETKANIFKPLGYENLHQYVNYNLMNLNITLVHLLLYPILKKHHVLGQNNH